ncbi:hypothetical protein [Micromonospora sp. C95]|uniref:hypothetical protein n=1 Tax=Micromonospora sp. C95 TaxID=2824882 RepID=UPI001B376433|nr:hypothetical protein [Micromonospora sp. C95]MBQ1026272.1 hypothetical protein [Micromonospora sp. C95]
MAAGTAAPASGPVAAVRVDRKAASVAVRVDREAASAGPEPAARAVGRAARAVGRAAEQGLVPAGTDRASAAPVLGRAVPATATAG